MLASDLHVHLDGSIRDGTLISMAREAGLVPTSAGDEEFLSRLRFCPGMSLASCLDRFGVTVGLLQTRRSLARVARELVCDCYLDGVRHLEIRFCPALHTRESLDAARAVEAVLEGTEEGVSQALRGACGEWLSARVVLAILQGMPEDLAESLVDIALGYRSSGVAGVDLAGDEALFNAVVYEKPLRRASDSGLFVTVHAGEGPDASHVLEAVTKLGASRVGHGVAAASDAGVVSLLAERGIAVEICLSSNLHTGAVASLDEHPLIGLSEAGVPVVICTDNRFFSSTTLSREYDLASSEVGAGRDVIERSVLASAECAFLPSDERERLSEIYSASLGLRDRGGVGSARDAD
jgi:adenosine deaminase